MGYTWSDFKTKVKAILSDAAINDDTGVAAITAFVRGELHRDFTGNLDEYKVNNAKYESQKRALLGYSITLDTSTLQSRVREQLSDSIISDDTAVRAVAEFVMAQADKDLLGNFEGNKLHTAKYISLRAALAGYSITLDDATLKSRVKAILTDVTPSDTTAIQAVAEYVKYKISREVNHDIELAASYYKTYATQKAKLLGYTISISGNTLRAAVNPLITVDANRLGIGDANMFVDKCIAEAVADISGFDTYLTAQIAQAKIDLTGLNSYINRKIDLAKADIIAYGSQLDVLMRQAVIDIQSHIILYRAGHQTNYALADVAAEGSTSKGNLPGGMVMRDAYFVTVNADGSCVQAPMTLYDWGKRFNLINNAECINDADYKLSLNPECTQFYVYPALDDNHEVSIFWDGLKSDFQDSDTTPFDDACALAVAEYVMKGKASPDYRESRRRLYLDAKERSQMRYE